MLQTLDDILRAWEHGSVSTPIALMEMLLATRDAAVLADELAARQRNGMRTAALLRLLAGNRAGCDRVLRIAADDGPFRDVRDVAAMFDRCVEVSEEGSVALYSLGNAGILEDATGEIAARLREWGLLGVERTVLDVGCGIGRLSVALSRDVRQIVGVDVSARMIDVARRRAAGLANARFEAVDGRQLPFAVGSFDLVLAVDSMPYIVGLGAELVDRNFREIARMLRPGGDFVVLHFSYRDDLEADRRNVAALAARHGFEVRENGATPFSLWNAAAFRLTRRSS
jgi:SAM-dependent methyltransferase